MSNTPLYDALCSYAQSGTFRGHMPGHKGKPLPCSLSEHLTEIDFTELPETGNLYEGNGPIALAEARAAAHYGAGHALFLTGGSTQGVLTMLGQFAGKTVLFDRNSHKSTASAMTLFDITPRYLVPDLYRAFHISGHLSCKNLQKELQTHPEIAAVFLTSPNYYGIIQDIPAIAEICHSFGKPLLVDGAHGAHLTSLGIPNAIACGADAEVCSLHKTARALGQAAILLVNDRFRVSDLRRTAAMVGTSSPSYAVMASIDCAVHDLAAQSDTYRTVAQMAARIKKERIIADTPFHCLRGTDTDPCRLVINTAGFGMSGRDAAKILEEEYGVVAEMADNGNVIFILTSADTQEELDRLCDAFVELGKRCAEQMNDALRVRPVPPLPVQVCTPRTAFFSAGEELPIDLCEDRISAETVTVYPPGVLILAPGEIIDKKTIVYLKENGYNGSVEMPEGKKLRVIQK